MDVQINEKMNEFDKFVESNGRANLSQTMAVRYRQMLVSLIYCGAGKVRPCVLDCNMILCRRYAVRACTKC